MEVELHDSLAVRTPKARTGQMAEHKHRTFIRMLEERILSDQNSKADCCALIMGPRLALKGRSGSWFAE